MRIPEDNLQDERKIALGKALFFDQRLSFDESISCASCHEANRAFTDGQVFSNGVLGRKSTRNAPSLLNIGFSSTFMFDGEINTLEKQVIVPIQEHVEMGMEMRSLIQKLREIPFYQQEAKAIFNRDFDPYVLTRSIASYERTLISLDSPFDRYYYKGDKKAISKLAISGWKFFSEKLPCLSCHTLPFFSSHRVENNGLVSILESDKGRFRIKGDSTTIGFFKIPSLRNISFTAPYMHDGRFKNLDEVLDFYVRGGNQVYNQNKKIKPFKLSSSNRKALLAFFETLTEVDIDKKYLP